MKVGERESGGIRPGVAFGRSSFQTLINDLVNRNPNKHEY